MLSRQQLEIINRKTLRYPLHIAEKDYVLAVVNPELNLAQKYAGSVEPVSLYPNPELMLAKKLAAASAPVTQYLNPELALAQRYAVEGGAGSTQCVVNPELSIVTRFTEEAYDGSFLVTNPEIKIHLQYVNGG